MSFLSIQHIYKKYDKDNHALVDFSLEVEKGEIWSIVGESGSGKSTLLRIVAGIEIQDEGRVYINNHKILNPGEKLVPGYEEIQLIHQQHNLYPHSTVAENIGRPLLLFDKAYKEERVQLLLDLLNLTAHRDKLPRELSGGQQQKVAIGRALSIEPEVLLLDEPFSSLDNIQKRALIRELKLIFQELNVTVLLVTHDIDDAMTMTDKLCIIKSGEIVQMGSAQEVYEAPKDYYVAKLLTELNSLPYRQHEYIRPVDLVLHNAAGCIKGRIINSQYLIDHNLLTVAVDGASAYWTVEDRSRAFNQGGTVWLSWAADKVLQLPSGTAE